MAKVEVLNIREIELSLRKKITKAARDEEVRLGIGEIVVNDIKDMDFGRPAEKTIEWRDRYTRYNSTDPKHQRNKINITFRGELLQDLQDNVRVETTSGGIKYELSHTERLHKKYNKKGGKIGKTRSTYTDISDGIINKHGYNYLKFGDNTLDKMIKFIRNIIIKKIK